MRRRHPIRVKCFAIGCRASIQLCPVPAGIAYLIIIDGVGWCIGASANGIGRTDEDRRIRHSSVGRRCGGWRNRGITAAAPCNPATDQPQRARHQDKVLNR